MAFDPEIDQAPGPFDWLTDVQVLNCATEQLRRVQESPTDSPQRVLAWAAYETYKAELDVRLYRHVLKRIKESKQ